MSAWITASAAGTAQLLRALRRQSITFNSHDHGLPVSEYRSNPALNRFFRMLSFNKAPAGPFFVSTMLMQGISHDVFQKHIYTVSHQNACLTDTLYRSYQPKFYSKLPGKLWHNNEYLSNIVICIFQQICTFFTMVNIKNMMTGETTFFMFLV